MSYFLVRGITLFAFRYKKVELLPTGPSIVNDDIWPNSFNSPIYGNIFKIDTFSIEFDIHEYFLRIT